MPYIKQIMFRILKVNVLLCLAEDGDVAILRICAADSRMSCPWLRVWGGILYLDGCLELETVTAVGLGKYYLWLWGHACMEVL
jgi:hypothetical protein